MSYEKYYPGGWQSGESGGTPITPEALNHIEDGIINSDPAGYGFGESGAKVVPDDTDLNTLTSTGWYCTHGTEQMYALVNIPEAFTYGGGLPLIRVEALTGGWIVQTIYRIEEFAPYAVAVARRQCMSGVWYPWEYENPPMQPSVEYRTTERYYGKPVYAKRINQYYPSLGGSGIVDTAIPHEITEFEEIVRCDANISEYTLPVLWSDTQSMSVLKVDATNITLRIINDNWNPCNFRFTLYYTKQ